MVGSTEVINYLHMNCHCKLTTPDAANILAVVHVVGLFSTFPRGVWERD